MIPTPPPPPTPDWPTIPRWCSRCEVHQATNHKPLCPVCVDDDVRAAR